jgi:hypothetical protein
MQCPNGYGERGERGVKVVGTGLLKGCSMLPACSQSITCIMLRSHAPLSTVHTGHSHKYKHRHLGLHKGVKLVKSNQAQAPIHAPTASAFCHGPDSYLTVVDWNLLDRWTVHKCDALLYVW